MKGSLLVLFLVSSITGFTYGQKHVDRVKFFADTSVVNATLAMNFKKVLAKRAKEGYIFPARLTCKLDSVNISDQLSVEVRGHFRRSYCNMPPLKLIFKSNSSSAFYKLKSLKLVNTCTLSGSDDQNVLKEFLVYKIYNLLTDLSFRARLLNLSYLDSSGTRKTVTRHAFLLEDIKQLAKRNNCTDWTNLKSHNEAASRTQMTTVSIFEYMIGNTDWSVPARHNMRVVHSDADSTAQPDVIPYDFDYSGLVNTTYAIPDESLHIESVRVRVYRGAPRTMDEFNAALAVFKQQKDNIYALINNFNLLTSKTKKEMTDYLDGFYAVINDPGRIKYEFISNAVLR